MPFRYLNELMDKQILNISRENSQYGKIGQIIQQREHLCSRDAEGRRQRKK